MSPESIAGNLGHRTLGELRDIAERNGVTYWDDTWRKADFVDALVRAGLTSVPKRERSDPTPRTVTAEEAVEKALLYTFQLSNKDYRKMQTAMSEVSFIRALEQDGYTVAALTPSDPLDVDRLADALDNILPGVFNRNAPGRYSVRIAAEYARLSSKADLDPAATEPEETPR